jgi:hypothetical protein
MKLTLGLMDTDTMVVSRLINILSLATTEVWQGGVAPMRATRRDCMPMAASLAFSSHT